MKISDRIKKELKDRNDEREQSPLEAWVLKFFPLAGIYDYVLEYQVDYYFLDIAWKKIKFCVELDGKEFHSKLEDVERDNKKNKYLKDQGWEVYRIPSDECWNPTVLVYHLRNIARKVNKGNNDTWWTAEMLGYQNQLHSKFKEKEFGYCKKCEISHFESDGCREFMQINNQEAKDYNVTSSINKVIEDL